MTFSRFVLKNATRNRRRALLTVLSVGFSLLLLTVLMSVWRSFYMDAGPPASALRLVARNRISLTFTLPAYDWQKIAAVPGVRAITPMNWFGGVYINNQPKNFFAQFGVDPRAVFHVYPDWQIASAQKQAFIHDRQGAAVNRKTAKKYGWKLGQRIVLRGTIYPVNLHLKLDAIFHSTGFSGLIYHQKYVADAVSWARDNDGAFYFRVGSASDVPRVERVIGAMFHNSSHQVKVESEKAFQLSFVSMLGNVKAFILSICSAVVFAILLVTANTMAMSIRERIREIAVLKTLGFEQGTILKLFVGEAVAVALAGGILGSLLGAGLLYGIAHSPNTPMMGGSLAATPGTLVTAWAAAALIGLASGILPAWRAARLNILQALRHVG